MALRYSALGLGQMAGWDAAIVIPAKDEATRLHASLDAVAIAIRAARTMTTGIVLVVNNTTDATAQRALDWALGRTGIPFVLIDCAFGAYEAGAGAARRLGLEVACDHLTATGALLTTDADTLVHADWVIRNLVELREAELICGTVLGRVDEALALPAAISAHGSIEQIYAAASIALVARLDPQPHDPAPAHHKASGASMAVSRRVYEAVSGMPPLSMSEDRAFAERVDAHDYRVRYSAAAIVETSYRLTGRTSGGMAGALRARATEPDPHADQWLEAVDMLALRHELRGRLRADWPDVQALHGTLAEVLGPLHAHRIMAGPPGPHFGAFFAALEQLTPTLGRERLRLSDCRRELPRLRELLATIGTTAGRYPAQSTSRVDHHAAI